MTGIRTIPGKFECFDGVNLRPKIEAAPEAKAVVWTRGGKEEIDRAKEHAASGEIDAPIVRVFTFAPTEADPLGKARTKILRAFGEN